jgi:hypothetical protein
MLDGTVQSVTLEMLEYGVPVEVRPPPADQVVEAGEFNQLRRDG